MSPARPSRESLAEVDTWVFDLDNTLYPVGSDLWPKIDMRITLFMMAHYGLDGLSARALQKYFYHRFGTTLLGMMQVDAVDPERFLAFVHDVDRSSIVANPALAAAVRALPGRKLIFTNGSRHHAERTAEALGLEGLFDGVFDIVASELVPKPEPGAYRNFLRHHDVDPRRAIMFEDIPRNLVAAKEVGMTTVLVLPTPEAVETRDAFEVATGEALGHVDYLTADLTGFLVAAMRTGSPASAPA